MNPLCWLLGHLAQGSGHGPVTNCKCGATFTAWRQSCARRWCRWIRYDDAQNLARQVAHARRCRYMRRMLENLA